MEEETIDESRVVSYHDVIVYVNGEPHKISANYSYDLICTKSAGWQLWWRPMSGAAPRQLGGEFHGGAFRIEVRGVVVCDNGVVAGKPVPAPADGWDGAVRR